jgi:hypothetical protein
MYSHICWASVPVKSAKKGCRASLPSKFSVKMQLFIKETGWLQKNL